MDGTGEHHLKQSLPGSEGQKSYVDYRPKTLAVIFLDMDHMLRGEHIHEE
jgi:hypothetical protein